MSFKNNLTEKEFEIFKKWLDGMLLTDTVSVSFVKVDGSQRIMKATRKSEFLPKQDITESKRIPNPDVCTVWDVEAKGWRSFRYDSVTEIKVILGE